MDCIEYIDVDAETVMITVLETVTLPGFWRDTETVTEKRYIGLPRDRIWIDDKGEILPNGSRIGLALWQVAVNKLAERRLDRFNSTC